MKHLLSILLLCSGSLVFSEDAPPLGFDEGSGQRQRELEARFDTHLDTDDLRRWMKRMSSRPHHAGSPHGEDNARWMVRQLRSWGFDAELARYDVLFPTPTLRKLELLEPDPFGAALTGDGSSTARKNKLPPYNIYSIDGDVTGELVYVNYGIPEDYERLAELGIDVRGKIVIARYGRSWRGIKPKLAAENGAVGCILYSDPHDDGYRRGDVYPDGPFKPGAAVQRGSVSDMPLFPGDPSTPGKPSLPGTPRPERAAMPTLTKIPVLPISYDDALPLLRALGGPVAPPQWRGALPLTYHVGPGPAKVRLQVAFDWKLVPAYNVIARLEGRERPERWVLRGNHHDAWVLGADDPVSGLVALMAEARAVGKLAADGWRPRRTLVYAAWDAEEPGLLGSTEWVEHHAETLRERAVAYINSDSNGRGFLSAGGSHTLEALVVQVADEVLDPQTGATIGERVRARRRVDGVVGDDLRLSALGSGSDYTPFLQHLGVASLNLGFGGENSGGEYHTAFDSFEHYTRFGDPKFEYGLALARTAGRVALRLAEAPRLPWEFTRWTETVDGYVDELDRLVTQMRNATERRNRLIEEGAFRLAADPTRPFVAPLPQTPVPHINLAPLRNAMTEVREAVAAYEAAADDRLGLGEPLPHPLLHVWNDALMQTERLLTDAGGLPGRPWYRHQVYAPGYYTGYGVKTLPGVREAIEQRRWDEVATRVDELAQTLRRFAGGLERLRRTVAPAES